MDRDDRLERSRRSDGGQGADSDLGPSPRRRREQAEQVQATLSSLMDDLEAIIEKAAHVPFSSKVLVDRDVYLETLDTLRSVMPESVVQAERIVRDRDRIVAQAEAESERIMSLARDQAAFLISERQLLRTAELQSETILNTAREEAKEIIASAQKYARDLLGQLENEALRIVSEIRKAANQVR